MIVKKTRSQLLAEVQERWRATDPQLRQSWVWLQSSVIDPFLYNDYTPPTMEELTGENIRSSA